MDCERLQRPDALTVLFDPLAYAPDLRALSARMSGAERAALNDWLLVERGVHPVTMIPASQRPLVERLLKSWDSLPVVALLLGAHLYRRALLGSPLLLRLPPAIHVFVQVPLPLSAVRIPMREGSVLTLADLVEAGTRCLRGLIDALPEGLWQRVGLALGQAWRSETHPRPAIVDPALILMVLTYASRNPQLRDCLSA